MTTAAGLCSIVLGSGFGLPGVLGTLHFARTGEVWTLLGFPTYGGGPFERLGLTTSLPLLTGFLLVCLAEVTVGVMLLRGVPRAAVMSYLLLPCESVFWVGFALPFGPLLGFARTVLLLLA
ncbi:MAG TPA: hypothetical protein VF763_06565 [Candidatus Limnocylindrales bacterium]